MADNMRERAPETVRIAFHSIRNLTSPEEKDSGVQTYFANIPVSEIPRIATGHNLRDYIAKYNKKKRNQVHRAIRATLDSEPKRFINRNSGVTICCSAVDIDEKRRLITLSHASLINGAQTQGEIAQFLQEAFGERDDEPDFHIRAEINVDPEEVSVVETAIARNTATSVKSISQAGARGILDELGAQFMKDTDLAITKKETDDDPEAVDTKLLLQLTRLLMPPSIAPSSADSEVLKPYKQKEKCLDDFAHWYKEKGNSSDAAARYQFVLDMAAPAWGLYVSLNSAEEWNGQRVQADTKQGGRALRRDPQGRVEWVAPGILFPMIKAISAFVVQSDDGSWSILYPDVFDRAELISSAVKLFRSREINLDPYVMGRSIGAYDGLAHYTKAIVQILKRLSQERDADPLPQP